MPTPVRQIIIFRGTVQGVFFRATAEQIAQGFNVTGWVRNEPDGSVRLVAEGEPPDVERFVEAIKAAKRSNIDRVEVETGPATGEFAGFTIRR